MLKAFVHAEDQAQYRRPAHRDGVELYHAQILKHSFEPHLHEAYGLGAITDGVGRFRWRGGEHLAPRATLMLMNPEDIHTGEAATDHAWAYRMVYLDEALLADLYGGPTWRFDAAVAHDAEAATRAATLIAALWQAREPLAFDSALLALVQGLSRHAHRAPQRPDGAAPRFDTVLDFMRSHLDRRLDTEQLAAVAGLSPFHFLRSFKAHQHATPQQALMALRLFEAKRLLASGEPPAEVAAAVGLADQAHLTRSFARRYGVTPSRYQQQLGTRPRR
ncbi:AraC family transcriptional regulator [Roseateles amylovorans]|uniref:AraC family transcriptional regulator n=1 Tax=Roseateles amylovorans TaxID=2978473 RepID=A0ABY6B0M0_9BURK|nr:AraC family transcriptional regulator [Roseateles amylovorans]UXH78742.1 AraC family transcriptional regulator [Roseateles amylovorans]